MAASPHASVAATVATDRNAVAEFADGAVVANALFDAAPVSLALGVPRVVREPAKRDDRRRAGVPDEPRATTAQGSSPVHLATPQARCGEADAQEVRAHRQLSALAPPTLPLRRLYVAWRVCFSFFSICLNNCPTFGVLNIPLAVILSSCVTYIQNTECILHTMYSVCYIHTEYRYIRLRSVCIFSSFLVFRTKSTLTNGNFMGVMNVLMQLRKVCNHPNLFEPRPVTSPLQLEPIVYTTSSCVFNIIEDSPHEVCL